MSPRRSLALTGAMDPSFLHGSSEQSFEFAFNSSNFSDRVLRIEVVADRKHEDAPRDPKRRKERAVENSDCEPDQINIDHPDLVDVMICEGNDGEGAAMGEMLSDDEIAYTDDTRYIPEPSPVLRVKSVFISSAILAAKSPFFYKLFSNGMLESDLRHATLRIRESEETALLELLSYMYSNKLSTTSAAGVLDVLMAADKFEVTSCMRHCCELLCNLPMTLESALVYLGLPSSISMAHAAQPLMDAAKNFLVTRYKDINKFPEEVMQLPLAGLEAILSSSDLQVASEDVVFDMVIKWSRSQYPDAEERQFVLGSLFRQFVRFPHMTCRKLKKVLSCNELDHELVSKVVMDAVFYKAELPHRQRALSSEDSENQRFTERAYKYRPVKIVEFESPHQQCIVYLDLKKEECTNLFPSGRVYSQAFHIGGHGFFLSAHCNMDLQGSLHCFGLFLGMQERGGGSLRVDYEIAARAKPNCDFASKYRGSYTFSGGKAVGYRNLFGVPWSSFIADDSPFFINGMLHLRADLTIRQPQNDARN